MPLWSIPLAIHGLWEPFGDKAQKSFAVASPAELLAKNRFVAGCAELCPLLKCFMGGLTFSRDNMLYVTTTIQPIGTDERFWGGEMLETILLVLPMAVVLFAVCRFQIPLMVFPTGNRASKGPTLASRSRCRLCSTLRGKVGWE